MAYLRPCSCPRPRPCQADNVFFHLTYERDEATEAYQRGSGAGGGSEEDGQSADVSMTAPALERYSEGELEQIASFGQTPLQLFQYPHPPRAPARASVAATAETAANTAAGHSAAASEASSTVPPSPSCGGSSSGSRAWDPVAEGVSRTVLRRSRGSAWWGETCVGEEERAEEVESEEEAVTWQERQQPGEQQGKLPRGGTAVVFVGGGSGLLVSVSRSGSVCLRTFQVLHSPLLLLQ